MDDAFGNWLAGFIDGEGSFSIAPLRGRSGGVYYRCTLAVSLRADDAAILDVISERTGDWAAIEALRERLMVGRAYEEPALDSPAAL